jgi:hypothetical protein
MPAGLWPASSGSPTPAGSTNPLIPQALLLILLVESLLDAIFIVEAGAPGAVSSHVGSTQMKTKQSGVTMVAALKDGTHTFQRQHDAVKNCGLKFTMKALVHDAAGTAIPTFTAPAIQGTGSQAGAAVTGSDTAHAGPGATVHQSLHAAEDVKDNMVAYFQYAQWLIIKEFTMSLSHQQACKLTGEELLLIQDIYGVGSNSIDMVSNTCFSDAKIASRVAASSFDTGHVISLAFFFETGPNSLLPSSVPYTEISVHVAFNTYGSVCHASSDNTKIDATLYAQTPAHFDASLLYDQYVITHAEKDLFAKISGHQPYTVFKTGSFTSAVKTVGAKANFDASNVNFLGSDMIIYGKDPDVPHFSAGKYGAFGTAVPVASEFILNLNGNPTSKVDTASTLWNYMQGATHFPVCGALYWSPAPGHNLSLHTPAGTVPWSRLDNVKLEVTSGVATTAGITFNYISTCWSTLQIGKGMISPAFSG